MFHNGCVTYCVFDLLQHHLQMGPVQEQQVRISLHAETRDGIAVLPWKYRTFDHTGLLLFVEKINHKRCFFFLVPTFPVLSLHWNPVLKWLLSSLLAHSLSLNLYSSTAVACFTPR